MQTVQPRRTDEEYEAHSRPLAMRNAFLLELGRDNLQRTKKLRVGMRTFKKWNYDASKQEVIGLIKDVLEALGYRNPNRSHVGNDVNVIEYHAGRIYESYQRMYAMLLDPHGRIADADPLWLIGQCRASALENALVFYVDIPGAHRYDHEYLSHFVALDSTANIGDVNKGVRSLLLSYGYVETDDMFPHEPIITLDDHVYNVVNLFCEYQEKQIDALVREKGFEFIVISRYDGHAITDPEMRNRLRSLVELGIAAGNVAAPALQAILEYADDDRISRMPGHVQDICDELFMLRNEPGIDKNPLVPMIAAGIEAINREGLTNFKLPEDFFPNAITLPAPTRVSL